MIGKRKTPEKNTPRLRLCRLTSVEQKFHREDVSLWHCQWLMVFDKKLSDAKLILRRLNAELKGYRKNTRSYPTESYIYI